MTATAATFPASNFPPSEGLETLSYQNGYGFAKLLCSANLLSESQLERFQNDDAPLAVATNFQLLQLVLRRVSTGLAEQLEHDVSRIIAGDSAKTEKLVFAIKRMCTDRGQADLTTAKPSYDELQSRMVRTLALKAAQEHRASIKKQKEDAMFRQFFQNRIDLEKYRLQGKQQDRANLLQKRRDFRVGELSRRSFKRAQVQKASEIGHTKWKNNIHRRHKAMQADVKWEERFYQNRGAKRKAAETRKTGEFLNETTKFETVVSALQVPADEHGAVAEEPDGENLIEEEHAESQASEENSTHRGESVPSSNASSDEFLDWKAWRPQRQVERAAESLKEYQETVEHLVRKLPDPSIAAAEADSILSAIRRRVHTAKRVAAERRRELSILPEQLVGEACARVESAVNPESSDTTEQERALQAEQDRVAHESKMIGVRRLIAQREIDVLRAEEWRQSLIRDREKSRPTVSEKDSTPTQTGQVTATNQGEALKTIDGLTQERFGKCGAALKKILLDCELVSSQEDPILKSKVHPFELRLCFFGKDSQRSRHVAELACSKYGLKLLKIEDMLEAARNEVAGLSTGKLKKSRKALQLLASDLRKSEAVSTETKVELVLDAVAAMRRSAEAQTLQAAEVSGASGFCLVCTFGEFPATTQDFTDLNTGFAARFPPEQSTSDSEEVFPGEKDSSAFKRLFTHTLVVLADEADILQSLGPLCEKELEGLELKEKFNESSETEAERLEKPEKIVNPHRALLLDRIQQLVAADATSDTLCADENVARIDGSQPDREIVKQIVNIVDTEASKPVLDYVVATLVSEHHSPFDYVELSHSFGELRHRSLALLNDETSKAQIHLIPPLNSLQMLVSHLTDDVTRVPRDVLGRIEVKEFWNQRIDHFGAEAWNAVEKMADQAMKDIAEVENSQILLPLIEQARNTTIASIRETYQYVCDLARVFKHAILSMRTGEEFKRPACVEGESFCANFAATSFNEAIASSVAAVSSFVETLRTNAETEFQTLVLKGYQDIAQALKEHFTDTSKVLTALLSEWLADIVACRTASTESLQHVSDFEIRQLDTVLSSFEATLQKCVRNAERPPIMKLAYQLPEQSGATVESVLPRPALLLLGASAEQPKMANIKFDSTPFCFLIDAIPILASEDMYMQRLSAAAQHLPYSLDPIKVLQAVVSHNPLPECVMPNQQDAQALVKFANSKNLEMHLLVAALTASHATHLSKSLLFAVFACYFQSDSLDSTTPFYNVQEACQQCLTDALLSRLDHIMKAPADYNLTLELADWVDVCLSGELPDEQADPSVSEDIGEKEDSENENEPEIAQASGPAE